MNEKQEEEPASPLDVAYSTTILDRKRCENGMPMVQAAIVHAVSGLGDNL
jgi:hypothetical protein